MTDLFLYILDSQCEALRNQMDLRPPQFKSLSIVRDILKRMPGPISQISSFDIARRTNMENPQWTFPENFLILTFALATGVGKTRLMGALMALLFRTGQSKNFVLLAPRDAVLRKLMEECRSTSSKYIFVDTGVVAQPKICHRGNLLEFDPVHDQLLGNSGPNIFIMSPQLLTTDGRIRQKSEFAGSSILEYLKSCDDLVVFIDESHHLTTREFQESESVWGAGVRELSPKMAFAMTATPRPEENVGYEYGLRQCLQEGRYTKRARLIVHSKSPEISDEIYDEFVLNEGLSRLDAKRDSIANVRKNHPSFPDIEPVMLVCARSQEHADQVGGWLQKEKGLSSDEVLVIHAERKSERDLLRLKDLENPGNRIRVVVQVHVLEEGWDVTNVFVIAPLRYVQSFTNARQVMGRGLRLPLGYRVMDEEVDRLDILAFGQDTFKSVYDDAVKDFGGPEKSTVEVVTVETGNEGGGSGRTVAGDDEETSNLKRIEISLVKPLSIQLPRLNLLPPEPDLDEIPSLTAATLNMTTLDLSTLLTSSVSASSALPKELVVAIVTERVFREFTALSAPLHQARIGEMIREILDEHASDGQDVAIDYNILARLMVEALKQRWVTRLPEYQRINGSEVVNAHPVSIHVPEDFGPYLDSSSVDWRQIDHVRLPVGNWHRCTHEAAKFDSLPEFKIAQKLDSMDGVLWMRNDPPQLAVPTMRTGNHAPDFIVRKTSGGDEVVLLLEIKGEHLWSSPGSEPRTNARDTKLWVKQANQGLKQPSFQSSLILGGDVDNIENFEHLIDNDASDS